MREIKFRAWDKRDSRMYSVFPNWCFSLDGNIFGRANTLVDLKKHIDIMQYTGLKDRHGVEIYEGDIVDDYYFKNSVSRHKVYWADSYGCWSTINLKDPIVDRKQLGYFNEAKDLHRNEYLEVIGNIYENQELLKDKYGE